MGPGGPTLRSSAARRFLLLSERAEKSSILYELMPLKTSVPIPPEVFQ
jgi:hypothetical protein